MFLSLKMSRDKIVRLDVSFVRCIWILVSRNFVSRWWQCTAIEKHWDHFLYVPLLRNSRFEWNMSTYELWFLFSRFYVLNCWLMSYSICYNFVSIASLCSTLDQSLMVVLWPLIQYCDVSIYSAILDVIQKSLL